MVNNWEYKYVAKVLRVVDGDTVDLEIDLGLKTYVKERVRLYGINAPETYGVRKDTPQYEAGMIAKKFLQQQLEGQTVVIETHKDKTGKYGRYIAKIFLYGVDMNERMVTEGFAERYME